MQEAEVSLRVALYYIQNKLTDEDVRVSLDGAHIRTKGVVHFDIYTFLKTHKCTKMDDDSERWQGVYKVEGFDSKIIIDSKPGIGDVNIVSKDGNHLYIESKKGKKNNRSNSEYPLMREAIGQLMTGCQLDEKTIPIVAVPYSDKSYELACRWSAYQQIKLVGIRFMLVHGSGNVDII